MEEGKKTVRSFTGLLGGRGGGGVFLAENAMGSPLASIERLSVLGRSLKLGVFVLESSSKMVLLLMLTGGDIIASSWVPNLPVGESGSSWAPLLLLLSPPRLPEDGRDEVMDVTLSLRQGRGGMEGIASSPAVLLLPLAPPTPPLSARGRSFIGRLSNTGAGSG